MFNTGAITIAVDEAIADAGATGHFVVPGAPVRDVKPATKPHLQVKPSMVTCRGHSSTYRTGIGAHVADLHPSIMRCRL
jgi:hypothetical protein